MLLPDQRVDLLPRPVVDAPEVSKRVQCDGKADVLRGRVRTNIKQPVPPPKGSSTIDVLGMIHRMHSMISYYMGLTSTPTNSNVGASIIRLFLHSVEIFDAGMRSAQSWDVAVWISQFNY